MRAVLTVSDCPRCVARGKTWEGDDPACAFESGTFSPSNWACATALAIRDLLAPDCEPSAGVAFVFSEEQKAALVPLELEREGGLFLLASWYKSRGRTDVLAIVGDADSDSVVPLALAEAEEVIAHLERAIHGVVPTPAELRS